MNEYSGIDIVLPAIFASKLDAFFHKIRQALNCQSMNLAAGAGQLISNTNIMEQANFGSNDTAILQSPTTDK